VKGLKERIDKIETAGDSPYTFTFISFCGHGCSNSNNETLFVVPEFSKDLIEDQGDPNSTT